MAARLSELVDLEDEDRDELKITSLDSQSTSPHQPVSAIDPTSSVN